jgi:hypothetical protein
MNKPYIILEKIDKLFKNINRFQTPNKNTIVDVFYDVVKILQKKEERLNKPQLKESEILNAIKVIYSLYSKKEQVWDLDKMGNKHLYQFFNDGKATGEEKLSTPELKDHENEAYQYYEEEMLDKEFPDKLGRKISFTIDGFKHLYKDKETQLHIEKTENFQMWRKKRLPWILHTITHADQIYEEESNIKEKQTRYLYATRFKYKYTENMKTVEKIEYFLDVVSKAKAGLEFITAYHLEYDELLKHLEPCLPFPH